MIYKCLLRSSAALNGNLYIDDSTHLRRNDVERSPAIVHNATKCKSTNNITIKCSPMPHKPSTAKPMDFYLFNARSVRNKTLSIKDMIVERDIDCLAITETWLRSDDNNILQDLCPTGYDCCHVPRGSKGGGVALLYKKGLRIKKNTSIKNKFKSFEFADLTLLHSSTSLRTVIVYRPPPSNNNKSTVSTFFDEFPILLENLATTSSPTLVTGDFNFRISCNNQDQTANKFLQFLDAFNLKQNISQPTHQNGSTLDLIITRAEENIASNFNVFDPMLSDHCMVGCTLTLSKVPFGKKRVCYRRLNAINFDDFRHDVCTSLLEDSSKVYDDLDGLVDQYNNVLLNVLENHHHLRIVPLLFDRVLHGTTMKSIKKTERGEN